MLDMITGGGGGGGIVVDCCRDDRGFLYRAASSLHARGVNFQATTCKCDG